MIALRQYLICSLDNVIIHVIPNTHTQQKPKKSFCNDNKIMREKEEEKKLCVPVPHTHTHAFEFVDFQMRIHDVYMMRWREWQQAVRKNRPGYCLSLSTRRIYALHIHTFFESHIKE